STGSPCAKAATTRCPGTRPAFTGVKSFPASGSTRKRSCAATCSRSFRSCGRGSRAPNTPPSPPACGRRPPGGSLERRGVRTMIFPGMDPYLEDPQLWPGVHSRLIVYTADRLQPALRPRYVAAVEERVYLQGPDREVVPDV